MSNFFVSQGITDVSPLGSNAGSCFAEATGIAAGAAIVGGLTGKVAGKAAVKAAIKLAAKIGGRTLSGIGLALIAAEFTYCMMT